jgi:hypothetical protein
MSRSCVSWISLAPPSKQVEDGSIAALKRHAHNFTYQQMTSYLENADTYEYNTLAIGWMIT